MSDNKLLEKKVKSETKYQGLIFDVEQHEVILPDGEKAYRDIVINPEAAAVVAVDEDMNVIMVKQYRITCDKITLEIPAGKFDEGDTAIQCAVRELKEETGYTAKNMKFLFNPMVSVGFATENIHIFYASDLTEGETDPDDDEFVEVVKIPLKELVEMIMRNELADSKTVSGILAVARLLKV